MRKSPRPRERHREMRSLADRGLRRDAKREIILSSAVGERLRDSKREINPPGRQAGARQCRTCSGAVMRCTW